jgi:hypothetical protein
MQQIFLDKFKCDIENVRKYIEYINLAIVPDPLLQT